MKIQMIQCDNPKCIVLGHPEEGSTTKKHITPYMWFRVQFHIQGPVSTQVIEVCSLECVEPAMRNRLKEISD